MGKYTFKIDNKDPLYKKLIKLPTTYYKLQNNGDGYTIYSHNSGTSKVKNSRDVKLKWENEKIALKVKEKDGDEKDYVIEQEAIMDENRDDTINKLQTQGINTGIKKFESIPEDSKNYCIALYHPGSRQMTGVLNFINFDDENDPVLKKIKEDPKNETKELYFTIEDDNIYISDKDGTCLKVCPDGSCYQYQYKQNTCDVLTISDVSTVIDSLKQKFTLQKGEKLSDDIYEANIVLNDKPIATLPKIGYYMLNDQLVMRNHVTGEEVSIPKDFHCLKVVKFSDDYKLTFCNVLGNEFFEHKKYDPQYSNISDEYKFISLNCAKKEYNPNLWELFSHRPSFFIAEESVEPGSLDHYSVAVFELTNSKKGRKMATLIDEFGCFNENGQFKYCDYHEGTEYGIYNLSSIEKVHTTTGANSEFYLAGNDNIILHTIPQELF
ncbi:hypothetical protein [Wolbachia endosymbiont of Cantharis cryptica]|uniref:hypothetical protein n=1 Tax=Wolbachia endosymbiont of Cantharis cryptica TaxID=3066132 RepID=UPI00376EC0B1